jgi:hypothetical protein
MGVICDKAMECANVDCTHNIPHENSIECMHTHEGYWGCISGSRCRVKEGKKVYKVVHVEEDGSFSSIWAGEYPNTGNKRSYHKHSLKYEVGKVTKAHPDCESQELYCFNSLGGADTAYGLKRGCGNYSTKYGYMAVLLCEVSDEGEIRTVSFDECRVKGGILVKEVVWTDKPAEKWVDITGDCKIEIKSLGIELGHYYYILMTIPGCDTKVSFWEGSPHWEGYTPSDFKVEIGEVFWNPSSPYINQIVPTNSSPFRIMALRKG